MLLTAGADPRRQDSDGSTAFHYAASAGSTYALEVTAELRNSSHLRALVVTAELRKGGRGNAQGLKARSRGWLSRGQGEKLGLCAMGYALWDILWASRAFSSPQRSTSLTPPPPLTPLTLFHD